MQTLSFGFKKPENGDKGQTLFDDLSENSQLVNDHTHDGVNSAAISVTSLAKISQLIASAGWSNPVDGVYSQVVSMAGGTIFDSSAIVLRETSTGRLMSLPYEKVSANSFRLYCNDATKDITALYV